MDFKAVLKSVLLPLVILLIISLIGIAINYVIITNALSPELLVIVAFIPLILMFPGLGVILWAGYRAGKASASVLGGAIGVAIIVVISSLIPGILNLVLIGPLDVIGAIGLVIGLVFSLIFGLIFGAVGGFFGKKKAGVQSQAPQQPVQQAQTMQQPTIEQPIIDQTQPVSTNPPPRRPLFQKPSMAQPNTPVAEQTGKFVPNLEISAEKQEVKSVEKVEEPISKPMKKSFQLMLEKKEPVKELNPLQSPEKEIGVKKPSLFSGLKNKFKKPLLSPGKKMAEPEKSELAKEPVLEPVEKTPAFAPEHTPLPPEEKPVVKKAPMSFAPSKKDVNEKPASLKLGPLKSEPVKPESVEPVPAEPVPVEAKPIEPVKTEPVKVESVEPVPAEPVPVEPKPDEPVTIEPTPVESMPTEPVSAKQALSEEEQEQVKQLVEILGEEKENYSVEQVEKVIMEKGYSETVSKEVVKTLYG